TGVITAELYAKRADLMASEGGARNDQVQQQVGLLEQTLQQVDGVATDSLTTGIFMRSAGPGLGINVTEAAVDKEVAARTSLPFQLQLSIITVNALPATANQSPTPTSAQWAAAEKQAKALLAQVKGGKDFAALAKEKS